MLNPDGVIIGNTRVSLSGVDLNRRWSEESLDSSITPEVSQIKNYLKFF